MTYPIGGDPEVTRQVDYPDRDVRHALKDLRHVTL
jgi:hypothetical protein